MNKALKIQLFTRYVALFFSVVVVLYIVFHNYAPFGMSITYSTTSGSGISEMSPKDRLDKKEIYGERVTIQTSDLIYFTTKMPYRFDEATVKITYKNPFLYQNVHLGFQNNEGFSYETALLDAPLLNSLGWHRIGTQPIIYQRYPKYNSVEGFLKNLPVDQVIGTYQYNNELQKFVALKDYTPSKKNTIITVPLRGKHVMYVYVQDEPFYLKLRKHDLNWYKGEDKTTVKVYKENDLVYTATFTDDSISTASDASARAQELEIRNPGPELPESGVYKIVFDASEDSVVTYIETNLHKIVFEGDIQPIANAAVYPKIVGVTKPTQLFTNAMLLSAQVLHWQALQTIVVGNETIPLTQTHEVKSIIPQNSYNAIMLPQSDVRLTATFGFFAFSKEQFFEPQQFKSFPIKTRDDLELVDYIVSSYVPHEKQDLWQVAEHSFALDKAYVKNGKLRWLIRSPGLKAKEHMVAIKDITITFRKHTIIGKGK